MDNLGVFEQQASQAAKTGAKVLKIETGRQELLLVEDPGCSQPFLRRRVAGCLLDKTEDSGIGFYRKRRQRRAENHALEGLAAAQGHIDLPVGEGRSGIDYGPLKGESLAFMDGDGPGRFQRKLQEGSDLVLGDLKRIRIERILDILPDRRFNLDLLRVVRAADADMLAGDTGDLADLAVEIAFLR